ncbi:hypothetical protein T484DRAFT_1790818 [Baffinella frigidus]|nr:hypothetical protein T484DRAFT_1790818 [Cryptophyta sp. CCMP2293]
MFASAAEDRTVKVWDTRQQKAAVTFVGHQHEVLSVDWNRLVRCPDQSTGACESPPA